MTFRRALLSALLLPLALVASGCGGDDDDTQLVPDGGPDATVDATVDAGPPREICVLAAHSVVVLDGTQSGRVTPLRRLGSTTAGEWFADPRALVVDSVHDELLVSGPTMIAAYARSASGAALPLRTQPGVGSRRGQLALDAARDELFTLTSPTITVVSRTTGATLRALTVQGTTATGPSALAALALDGAHDELVVSSIDGLRVVPRTATGTTAAARTLTLRAGLSGGTVALDLEHDDLYVMVTTPDLEPVPHLLAFPRTASGTAAAASELSAFMRRIFAVDSVRGEIYLLGGGKLEVHPLRPTGASPPPRRVLEADDLVGAIDLAVCPAR